MKEIEKIEKIVKDYKEKGVESTVAISEELFEKIVEHLDNHGSNFVIDHNLKTIRFNKVRYVTETELELDGLNVSFVLEPITGDHKMNLDDVEL